MRIKLISMETENKSNFSSSSQTNNKKRLVILLALLVGILIFVLLFLFIRKVPVLKPVVQNNISGEQAYNNSKQILLADSKLNFPDSDASVREITLDKLPANLKELIFSDTKNPVVKIMREGSVSAIYKIQLDTDKNMPDTFDEYSNYMKDIFTKNKASISILNSSRTELFSLIEYIYKQYKVKITQSFISNQVKIEIYAQKN